MKLSLSLYSFFRNSFLVCLYCSFFCVELLHNFDPDKKLETASANIQSPVQTSQNHFVVKSKRSGSQGKFNFRLNKRFQPSFIPAHNPAAPEVFVEFAIRKYNNTYSNASLSNIFLLIRSLRAPPVV